VSGGRSKIMMAHTITTTRTRKWAILACALWSCCTWRLTHSTPLAHLPGMIKISPSKPQSDLHAHLPLPLVALLTDGEDVSCCWVLATMITVPSRPDQSARSTTTLLSRQINMPITKPQTGCSAIGISIFLQSHETIGCAAIWTQASEEAKGGWYVVWQNA
jgi:hypothetical protein